MLLWYCSLDFCFNVITTFQRKLFWLNIFNFAFWKFTVMSLSFVLNYKVVSVRVWMSICINNGINEVLMTPINFTNCSSITMSTLILTFPDSLWLLFDFFFPVPDEGENGCILTGHGLGSFSMFKDPPTFLFSHTGWAEQQPEFCISCGRARKKRRRQILETGLTEYTKVTLIILLYMKHRKTHKETLDLQRGRKKKPKWCQTAYTAEVFKTRL